MLTQNDIEIMRNNREGLKQARTTMVTLHSIHEGSYDPYTGEPEYVEVTQMVPAIVTGFTGVVGGEKLLVNGIAIEQGDIAMSFDYSINLEGVQTVEHSGKLYTLFSVQPKGIGDPNRYECVARRVT